LTDGDLEYAASGFIEDVQRIGTGPALGQVIENAQARLAEALAREFAAQPGTWTGAEVAEYLRRWRWK
jgi:hypothetical protein